MPKPTPDPLTDEERAIVKLMADIDGGDALENVYGMGHSVSIRPLDVAVRLARTLGWSDFAGRMVLDELRKLSRREMLVSYNLDERCDAPLDVAVFEWLDALASAT